MLFPLGCNPRDEAPDRRVRVLGPLRPGQLRVLRAGDGSRAARPGRVDLLVPVPAAAGTFHPAAVPERRAGALPAG